MNHSGVDNQRPRAEHPYRHGWLQSRQGTLGSSYPGGCQSEAALGISEGPEQVWRHISAHAVLYYPVADLDYQSLHLVGHLVDVFLLADWRYDDSEFDKIVDTFLRPDGTTGKPSRYRREPGELSFLVPVAEVFKVTTACTGFGLFNEPAWLPAKQPWCRITRLTRQVGELQRRTWFVYIVGNCVEIYQRLFIDQGTAPSFLWLQCPLGANPDSWAAFTSGSGDLGRAFTRATPQPRYVVAHHHQPGWQHTVPYRRFKAWHPAFDLAIYARPQLHVRC